MNKTTPNRGRKLLAAVALMGLSGGLLATPALADVSDAPAPLPAATSEGAVTPEATSEAVTGTPSASPEASGENASATTEATSATGNNGDADTPEKTVEGTPEATPEAFVSYPNASEAIASPTLNWVTVQGSGQDAKLDTSNPVTIPADAHSINVYIPEMSKSQYKHTTLYAQVWYKGAWRTLAPYTVTSSITPEATFNINSPQVENGASWRIIAQLSNADEPSAEDMVYASTPAVTIHHEGADDVKPNFDPQVEKGLVDQNGKTISVGKVSTSETPETPTTTPLALDDVKKWDNCKAMNDAGYGNVPASSPIAKLVDANGNPRFGTGDVLCKATGVKVPSLATAPETDTPEKTPEGTLISKKGGDTSDAANVGGSGGAGGYYGSSLAQTGTSAAILGGLASVLGIGGVGALVASRKRRNA